MEEKTKKGGKSFFSSTAVLSPPTFLSFFSLASSGGKMKVRSSSKRKEEDFFFSFSTFLFPPAKEGGICKVVSRPLLPRRKIAGWKFADMGENKTFILHKYDSFKAASYPRRIPHFSFPLSANPPPARLITSRFSFPLSFSPLAAAATHFVTPPSLLLSSWSFLHLSFYRRP